MPRSGEVIHPCESGLDSTRLIWHGEHMALHDKFLHCFNGRQLLLVWWEDGVLPQQRPQRGHSVRVGGPRMSTPIIRRAQKPLQLLEVVNGGPHTYSTAEIGIRRTPLATYDLPHVLYLMLGQLELLDSEGKPKGCGGVKGPCTRHHVVNKRLATLRKLLLQVDLEQGVVFARRHFICVNVANAILVLH